MKKTFRSSNGREIWVELINPESRINSHYITRMMGPGYVIAFWAPRPETEGVVLEPVQARITEEDVDDEVMMAALRYGQRLSELALPSDYWATKP